MSEESRVTVSESWTHLRNHHLPGMAAEHKRALFLRAAGLDDRAAASVEGISVSTFRRRLYAATCLIATCLPERAGVTPELRGAWVALHEDCLADVVG